MARKKQNPRKTIIQGYTQLVENKPEYYKTYKINKNSKTKKKRQINEPVTKLKTKQRLFLDEVLYKIPVPVHSVSHGFYRKRGIGSNAEPHVGKELVVNMDIKNFFPSIGYKMVKTTLKKSFKSDLSARIFSNICIYRNQLPQGAPTSPYLSNAVCYEMDEKLDNICKNHNISYTRYADDMTFSGKEKTLMTFLPVFRGIITAQGFQINEDKTKIMRKHVRQEVTGLVVNRKVNVKRKKYRETLQTLYWCKTQGVKNHIAYRVREKGEAHITPQKLREQLWGYANHVHSISPPKGRFLYDKILAITDWW